MRSTGNPSNKIGRRWLASTHDGVVERQWEPLLATPNLTGPPLVGTVLRRRSRGSHRSGATRARLLTSPSFGGTVVRATLQLEHGSKVRVTQEPAKADQSFLIFNSAKQKQF